MAATRSDPLPSFNFKVYLLPSGVGSRRLVAGFSECSGLESTLNLEEYPEGGVNDRVQLAQAEAELRARRDAMLRTFAIPAAEADAWLAGRRKRWIVGTPDEARAMVGRYAAAGIERIMLQDFLPWDHDMIELLGRELIGQA